MYMFNEKQEMIDDISKELNKYLETHTIDSFIKLIVNKLPKQMSIRIRNKLMNVNNTPGLNNKNK